MKKVYVLVNTIDYDEVAGVYSTLNEAIMASREYYEDNSTFADSKIIAEKEEEDPVWLVYEIYSGEEYERNLLGYIQMVTVKE